MRLEVRQDAVLHADDEHHRELQSLGLVQRDQGDGVRSFRRGRRRPRPAPRLRGRRTAPPAAAGLCSPAATPRSSRMFSQRSSPSDQSRDVLLVARPLHHQVEQLHQLQLSALLDEVFQHHREAGQRLDRPRRKRGVRRRCLSTPPAAAAPGTR